MAIPVHLQGFKAAGVYRVLFDKSTMTNETTNTLRLVVGYSEVGPFNCPIYVKNPQDFIKIFGNISKKLEKRGIFFHRLALQMVAKHPIICLNLKRFSGETVGASTISTDFNPNFTPIDDVHIRLEDIYDVTRFWQLSPEQLAELNSVEGIQLGNYINITMTDTKSNGASYFIRKASGPKVSQYNVTVNDWYSDKAEEKPEYLEDFGNSLISDFFAEIYVFKGKFKAAQVLASDSLKNYFVATDKIDDESETSDYILKLREDVRNAYNEKIDALDTLYSDPASNAIGHWIGCLIPFFKDKRGNYQSLDILFNQDNDEHKMMMSFNIDMLEEFNAVNIDLSGKLRIPVSDDLSSEYITNGVNNPSFNNPLSLETIYQGVAKTNLLGNKYAPVIADKISFISSLDKDFNDLDIDELKTGKSLITGSLYVHNIETVKDEENTETNGVYKVELIQVRSNESSGEDSEYKYVDIICKQDQMRYVLDHIGITNYSEFIDWFEKFEKEGEENATPKDEDIKEQLEKYAPKFGGTWWNTDYMEGEANVPYFPFDNKNASAPEHAYYGPSRIISNIRRLENFDEEDNSVTYTDIDINFICSFKAVSIKSVTTSTIEGVEKDSVYGSSVSFIKNDNWTYENEFDYNGGKYNALICDVECDNSLQLVLKKGDCLLADDGTVDLNNDKVIDEYDKNMYYDNVYVQDSGVLRDEEGNFKYNYILVSGKPLLCEPGGSNGWEFDPSNDGTNTDTDYPWGDDAYASEDAAYIIRIDAPLNQEIGEMVPHYLEGYVYKNDRPNGTDMYAKLEWQRFILSALSEYKGLRTGLLNKAEIDYRYIIDTFESYPQAELKAELSKLCQEKESAFCIANLPSIKTFVKCPYTSFTDKNGVFNAEYIVEGRNKKKPAVEMFSLPAEVNGASFIAFYTPLKFSDGYVDTIIPSAGLVSNLFMDKYSSRQPYYIVAGPNYGNIIANGLVGPDYKFSREELYTLEPFGFNCMVYRPTFGTFINANQTAKQTPLSALSRVNVRELVIYLQDEVEKVLQAYQWEFNNPTTRNAILDKANQICALIQANGGIQTYLNIMDESNNTPEIIDNEMAVLSTHIEPGFGCGKMIHELTLYRTGKMASSIIENK